MEAKLLALDSSDKTAIIDLAGINNKFNNNLLDLFNSSLVTATITNTQDSLKKHVDNIKNAKNIVFFLEIGKTDKILYNSIKSCNNNKYLKKSSKVRN